MKSIPCLQTDKDLLDMLLINLAINASSIINDSKAVKMYIEIQNIKFQSVIYN